MSGDVEWVRVRWNRLKRCFKKDSSKKCIATESKETLVPPNTGTSASDNENTTLDVYAKGYKEGFKAGLANRLDSDIASRSSNRASNVSSPPPPTNHFTATGSLTLRQIEQRAMNAGWNRAWEVARQEGWTKGCAHCSAHRIHETALQRRPSATAGSQSLAVSSINQNVTLRRRGTAVSSDSLPAIGY